MAPIASLALLLLLALANGELCTERNCTCTTVAGSTEINCQNLEMREITSFDNLPSKVFILDLSKNLITSIPVLDEIDGLKTLKLNHNQINLVNKSAFTNFNYLEHLDLSHNHITKLESLEGLSSLRTLNLSHNLLRSLPDEIFVALEQLQDLRLSGNPLHFLRSTWFRPLSKVTFLDVSSCALGSIPPDVFHEMIALVELDLSSNMFDEVPSEGLRSASKLRKLKMNGNKLTSLQKDSFKKCSGLEELELSDMGSLVSIKTGAFSGLKVLRKLTISHNLNLKELHFGAFQGLYRSLEKEWSIDELILRENGLEEIRHPSTSLCDVHTLDLQGNPWNCDCKLAWLATCDMEGMQTNDLRCSSPHNLKKKLIRDVPEKDMVCPPDYLEESHQKALRIIVVTSGLVGILFCTIIILIVVKKRKIMEWWYYRKRGSGAVYYVKAKSDPNERRVNDA